MIILSHTKSFNNGQIASRNATLRFSEAAAGLDIAGLMVYLLIILVFANNVLLLFYLLLPLPLPLPLPLNPLSKFLF